MSRKIPQGDGPFDSYITTTADYLAAETPTNAERLGLTAIETAQWSSRRDNWILVYAKYGDTSKRTKTVTAEKQAQKKAFIQFANPLLTRMSVNPALTNDDRGALNLPERDGHTERMKIEDAPVGQLIPMEGGDVKIRLRTSTDGNRASKHPDADHAEIRYMLLDPVSAGSGPKPGDPPPPLTVPETKVSIPATAEDCTKSAISKKAIFTLALGQANSGKRMYAFFRWVNASKNENSGPWSMLTQTVVV